MIAIFDVLDFRGFWWILLADLKSYRKSGAGLCELWLTVLSDPDGDYGRPEALGGYGAIPVPVFTDWWPGWEATGLKPVTGRYNREVF